MDQQYWIGQAKTAAAISGIPWEWIYAQWAHETGGYTSDVLLEYNNAGGLMRSDLQDYMTFPTVGAFTDYWANYIKLYAPDGVYDATTPDEYAAKIRSGGYYTDTLANYQKGMAYWLSTIGGAGTSSPFSLPVANAAGGIAPTSWADRLNPLSWLQAGLTALLDLLGRYMFALIGSVLFVLGILVLNKNTTEKILRQKGDE